MVNEDVKKLVQPLIPSEEQYRNVYNLMNDHLYKGLKKDTNACADFKCYSTYVHYLPTGKEEGQYLAVDLGGTNFRVLLVTFKGKNEAKIVSKIFTLSKKVMTGPGVKLFDHIAECLDSFVKEHNLGSSKLPLGFTFSFPCRQHGLVKAKLVEWTKGFSSPGVVGKDVGKLLLEAIERHGGLSIDIIGILNDSTGTLLSCAHRHPDCKIGLIVGTGLNCCYYERTACTELLEPELRKAHKNVIVNCEAGAFGDSGCLGFIQSEYDKRVDKASINERKQILEKLTSGMFLGELVREILLTAISKNCIFANVPNKADVLNLLKTKRNSFETRFLSAIGADTPPCYKQTKNIIKKHLCINAPSEEDCNALHFISECVVKRSGNLSGVLMSVLINKMQYPKVVVGVDGSVYRYHPKFDVYMREKMIKLVDSKKKFSNVLSEDGSGRGAALVAAVAAASSRSNMPRTKMSFVFPIALLCVQNWHRTGLSN